MFVYLIEDEDGKILCEPTGYRNKDVSRRPKIYTSRGIARSVLSGAKLNASDGVNKQLNAGKNWQAVEYELVKRA